MRPIAVVGVALIVLGLVALVYQGITYTSRETVLDIGPLHATADREKTLPLSPVLGIVAVAGGVALVIAGVRKHTEGTRLRPLEGTMEQTNHTSTGRRLLLGILAIGMTIGTATQARAQGFISPLIGYDFGGDAGCPKLNNCQDKKINASASFGAMGNVFGFEEEIAYAPNFFGNAPGLSSNVLTLMSNVMLVPKMGPVRPYVLAGIGLIKTHVDLTAAGVLTTDNNNLGWDVGGGLIGFVGDHIGVRGDLRYFHSFQDLTVLGFTLSSSKLNYGRASAGLVLKF